MLHYLYCCHFCGKPLFQKSFVCEKCLIVPSLKIRWQGSFKHYYLYEYNAYSEVFIKNLKYGNFKNVINRLAHRFLLTADNIVALPNSKNLVQDDNHAFALAQSIFPTQIIQEPFYKVSSKQSLLTKKQRQQIDLQQITKLHSKGSILLVDDLVTSGKTMEIAWKKLGKPPHTSFVSLCYTPKLGSKRN